jgi:hypothetical protein
MELMRSTIVAATFAVFLAAGLNGARADIYVVTNTSESGPGSLAQAIVDTNARTGPDTIVFNIPGSGVHLIDLSKTALPEITEPLVIDGYTQPGAHPNTLSVGDDAVILIQLDGGLNPAGSKGLTITAGSCLVRGLSITGFSVIPNIDPYNIQGGAGIEMKGPGSGNVIQGNFIGLQPDGITGRGNYTGIRERFQSIIGGIEPNARNVISGNGSGVEGFGGGIPGAGLLAGNYIGTDATGTRAVGNKGSGVLVGGTDVVIGGTAAGAANVISGNGAGVTLGLTFAPHGVAHADRALIQGNLIGTKADGVGPLGNKTSGIYFFASARSTIGGLAPGAGNVIAFNDSGIIATRSEDAILSNRIFGNYSRGIIIYDDPRFPEWTPPVITAEAVANGTATISGTLQSAPNVQFLVQVFADSQSLTTPNQAFLGSIQVTTDSNGTGNFTANVPFSDPDVIFNATSTAPTGGNGTTSEFSRQPAFVQNLSARAAVGTGENALIGGVMMKAELNILRGLGPSLTPYGVTNALLDPTLEFHDSTGAQMFDDNWRDNQNQATQIQNSGLAPTSDAEAAIMPFGPGSTFTFAAAGFAPYTAILRGKGDTTGIGVVEAYGLPYSNYGSYPELANISARGFVGTGENVIIGGFIVGGGTEPSRVVVRAIGPSLKAAAVSNPLPDPVLELHDGNGLTIKTNDNWEDVQKDDLQIVGLAPTDRAESAMLTRLGPGAYTAIVRGKGNATGVALVEVYRLP